MILPQRVKHPNGNYYKINTSHKIALRCFELSENEEVGDRERTYGIIRLLFGKEAPIDAYMLEKAVKYLQGGQDVEEHKNKKEIINLFQDKKHIDLSIESQFPHARPIEDDIHFWKYLMYIEALKGTVINDIVQIREADLNDYKDNKKQQKELRELKKRFAIKGAKEPKQITLKELYEEIQQKGLIGDG